MIEINHIVVLLSQQFGQLNELMFKVLIHLHFESSFLELFKVFFNLKEHRVS